MIRKSLAVLVVLSTVLLTGLVAAPEPVSAATQEYCTASPTGITVLPKWYKYLNPQWRDPDGNDGPQQMQCILDAEFPDAIPAILLAVFEILLRIAGMLAVVFVIYGGFQYLMSTGEPDKAKNARTTIVNALVGMMIAIFATVIVNLVGRNVG